MQVKKNNCICGKFCSQSCIFEVCKKCCISKLCKKHNSTVENNEILQKCCLCLKTNNEILLEKEITNEDNIYYSCDDCYNKNTKLFSKIICKQIPHNTTKEQEDKNQKQENNKYIFEIDEIDLCSCGQPCAKKCIIRSCGKCCIAKLCTRHKENSTHNANIDTDIDMDIMCHICGLSNNNLIFNTYYDKITMKNITYCVMCYNSNLRIINNILDNSQIDKSKLNVKYQEISETISGVINPEYYFNLLHISSRGRTKTKREKEIEHREEIEKLKNKYKDGLITHQIIKNEFEKISEFSIGDIHDITNYQCPICNKCINMEETYQCETCGKHCCDYDCIVDELSHCSVTGCSYCMRGICNNSEYLKYCLDCHVDYNALFYKKYVDTVLTSEILKSETIRIDLYDFNQSYKLNYSCPLCTTIVDYDDGSIVKCEECNEWICIECKISEHISCGRYDCRYCRNNSCYNSYYKNYCSLCVRSGRHEIYVSDSDDDNDSTDSNDSDKIIVKKRSSSPAEFASTKVEECNICYVNKKKYACIPCGHLCMCGECANKINEKCPICNVKTNSIIKIYI